jgi:hypothetical protein
VSLRGAAATLPRHGGRFHTQKIETADWLAHTPGQPRARVASRDVFRGDCAKSFGRSDAQGQERRKETHTSWEQFHAHQITRIAQEKFAVRVGRIAPVRTANLRPTKLLEF